VSYDPAETLAAFARDASITFPLLSDAGSATIRAYGIEDKDHGFPHPGTVVVDGKGTIVAKLFEDGFRKRHAPSALVDIAAALPNTR